MPPWLGPALIAGGSALGGWLSGRGNNENQTTTSTYNVDPGSRAYMDQIRQAGRGLHGIAMNHPGNFFLGPDQRSIGDQAQEFFNPYQDNVISGVRDQFNYQRGLASNDANRQATMAGAFGGSRAAIGRASRLGALDRSESQQIGNLMHSGYQQSLGQALQHNEYRRALMERQAQEPLWRAQTGLAGLQGAYGGPSGWTTTSTQSNKTSPWGTGIGLFEAGIGAWNEWDRNK